MNSFPMAPRPLGLAEHMFWLLNQNSPVNFGVCAQVEGRTTVEAWRAALDMVQQRHPNFSVKIEVDKDSSLYFHHVAEARIPLRIVERDDLRWEPEIEKEIAIPFDAREAPLVRAVLLHQAHRAVFILTSHHSIADGKSLVFAIRDTLQALSGKLLDPLPAIPPMDALLTPSSRQIERPDQDSAQEPTVKPSVYRKHDGSAPRVRALTLNAALTSELRRRSRREETTIQCALVAAAVEAARKISSVLEGATIRVSSPIDFRKTLGALDEVATLGAGVGISMEPQAHATFWDAARFVKRVVDPARTPEALSNIMAEMGQFISKRPSVTEAAALWANRLGYEINVSNLGEIPIENPVDGLRLAGFWGPSILMGFEGEQGIGVATANGSLNLLHTSYEPLPALLESIEERLVIACS